MRQHDTSDDLEKTALADHCSAELRRNNEEPAAVEIFPQQSVREQCIPSEIRKERFNAETIAAIKGAYGGKGLVRPFDTVDESMDSLNYRSGDRDAPFWRIS